MRENTYIGKYSLEETGRAMVHNQRTKGKAPLSDIKRAMRVSNARREQNPIEEGRADIVPWILYDRLTTAANTATAVEYDFFSTPLGGTKTLVDTNLQMVSQLPNPQHMNITSMQFMFSPRMLLVDLGTFLDQYYCQFWIGDKIYAQGPLHQFPGGAGVTGVSTQTAVGTFSNGFPSPNAVVDFRMGDNPIGHHILQGQNFIVRVIGTSFTTSAAGIGLNVECILEGVLSRGVQ